MQLEDKLAILADSAKYDVACTSSGVDRRGNGTGMGNSLACGICHSFSAVMIAVIVSTAAPTMYPVRPLPRGSLQN